MFKVYVKPDNVWDYFQTHKERLKSELDIIAEDSDTRLEVCLTEEHGLPMFTIEDCTEKSIGEVLESEGAVSQNDCMSVAEKFYTIIEEFSLPTEEMQANQNEPSDSDYELVAEREFEILEAFKQFLKVLVGYSEAEAVELNDETMFEIIPYVEQTIFECGFVPYHPQIITDDNGETRLIISPYDEMELM